MENPNNKPKANIEITTSTVGRIKSLDPQLVNRIAAGEIIQRPFNALKELIENSLDAGATSLNIQIKEGGLKLIQIQDNGCGIDKDDLKIVCERFTTSKLQNFDDLRTLNTFGFRGEALASISHVSRLTIVTKTANSPCAYKASYSEGKLNSDGIKPCAAASKGTQIIVEDLFYNTLIRKNALRSASEEFSKIYEVVSRYAIHNYHVSFFLKRSNENGVDLKTSGIDINSNESTTNKRCEENEKYLTENIGIVFGSELRKELERVSISYDDTYNFEMNGYVSNAKFTQLKQMVFILFINERLVDCQPLRKTLQTLFALYMPRNTYPFVYINLKMNPLNLDVNVHPTKHEVRFLYQDEIINKIHVTIEQLLMNSTVSRTYYMKNLTLETYLPNASNTPKLQTSASASTPDSKSSPLVYPYQLTRVDSKERTLDSFKHRTSQDANKSTANKESTPTTSTSQELIVDATSPLRNVKNKRSIKLKSLTELRDEVEKKASLNVRKIFLDMSFIGCIDNELALIQHKTGMHLVNTRNLSRELFYQLALFNFGNFGYFRFAQSIRVKDLIMIALDDPETQWEPEDGDKEDIAKRCEKLFLSKIEMLNDYFSIKFVTEDDGLHLEALPMLLEDYEPELIELPMFIMRLATEVNWKKEKSCFESICTELSLFYSVKNYNTESSNSDQDEVVTSKNNDSKPTKLWVIEHVIFPSFRTMLLPSSNCEDSCYKLVDLYDLYKVFERC